MENENSKVSKLINIYDRNLIFWDAWPDIPNIENKDDVSES